KARGNTQELPILPAQPRFSQCPTPLHLLVLAAKYSANHCSFSLLLEELRHLRTTKPRGIAHVRSECKVPTGCDVPRYIPGPGGLSNPTTPWIEGPSTF